MGTEFAPVGAKPNKPVSLYNKEQAIPSKDAPKIETKGDSVTLSSDPYTTISTQLGNLFSMTIVTTDFRLFIRDGFEFSADGKFHLKENKSEFKEMLSKLTGISASDITDEALDYLFGNQDGKLDKADVLMNPQQLIDRLKFLGQVFATNARSGGLNAFQVLRADNIVAVDFESEVPGYMGRIDLQTLADKKDPLFIYAFDAAARAYLMSETVSGAEKTAFSADLTESGGMLQPNKETSTLPAGVKKMLFVAFWNMYYNQARTCELIVPIKLIMTDPAYKKALFEGAFLNYVEGHGDKANIDAITHDMPLNFDKKAILRSAKERENLETELAKRKKAAPVGSETAKKTEIKPQEKTPAPTPEAVKTP